MDLQPLRDSTDICKRYIQTFNIDEALFEDTITASFNHYIGEEDRIASFSNLCLDFKNTTNYRLNERVKAYHCIAILTTLDLRMKVQNAVARLLSLTIGVEETNRDWVKQDFELILQAINWLSIFESSPEKGDAILRQLQETLESF